MRINRLRVILYVLLIAALFTPHTTFADAPDDATAKLIGTWECSPLLDEFRLKADPNLDAALARGAAIGAREIFHFSHDGTYTKVQVYRLTPQAGTDIAPPLTDTTKGTWTIVSGDTKSAKLELTADPGKMPSKPVDITIAFDGDDIFTTKVQDLGDLPFESTFTFRRSPYDLAVKWIQDNCVPDEKLDDQMNTEIIKYARTRQSFSIALGSHVVKSGKPTEIQGFCGQLLIFEFTKEQAKALNLDDDNAVTSGAVRPHEYNILSEVKIDKFDLTNPAPLDLTKPLVANVTLTAAHRLDADGDYSVRISCHVGGNEHISMYSHLASAPGIKSTFKCSFKAPDSFTKYAGPMTIAVDVCRTTKFEHGISIDEILSTSYATVLDVRPAK
jgi:hypothetical protein